MVEPERQLRLSRGATDNRKVRLHPYGYGHIMKDGIGGGWDIVMRPEEEWIWFLLLMFEQTYPFNKPLRKSFPRGTSHICHLTYDLSGVPMMNMKSLSLSLYIIDIKISLPLTMIWKGCCIWIAYWFFEWHYESARFFAFWLNSHSF